MNPTTVLIVDDHPGYADILASRLRDTGWTIRTATSAEAALEILQRETVDILASDFRLLQMNGAELVKRALALQPELYSIIFTGWQEREFAVESLRAGVSDFIDKSARIDADLRRAIQRGIEAVTISRLGRKLLEAETETEIFDQLIASLMSLSEFDGCCLAVLAPTDSFRIARAVDLNNGEEYSTATIEQTDSAYRYVIAQQLVYLPPLFMPTAGTLRPFFDRSQSIAVVPLTLRGKKGALGIEHQHKDRVGVEDVRLLNHIAQWISLAVERLHQQHERVRLEREIADDTRDRRARAAFHEIKNPLNNLAALVQLISNQLSGDARDSLLDNVTRINTALNQRIKPFIRGEDTPREDIVVADLIQEALTRFRLYPSLRPPSIVEKISPALPTFVGHRSLLVSALVSLLQNGATAVARSESPTLSVCADYAPGRDRLEILVTDNGRGIPEQNMDRIFDYAFTTAEDSTNTGYGLAFVKDVVELSDGRVTVDSREDQGATFKLSFPANTLNRQSNAASGERWMLDQQ